MSFKNCHLSYKYVNTRRKWNWPLNFVIQSLSVEEAAYNILWYNHSNNFKRLILIIIARSQKQVVVPYMMMMIMSKWRHFFPISKVRSIRKLSSEIFAIFNTEIWCFYKQCVESNEDALSVSVLNENCSSSYTIKHFQVIKFSSSKNFISEDLLTHRRILWDVRLNEVG